MSKVTFQQTISAEYQSYTIGVELDAEEKENPKYALGRAHSMVTGFIKALRTTSKRFDSVFKLASDRVQTASKIK